MNCPFCQQEHPEDAKFCPVTGKEINPENQANKTKKTCPHCDYINPIMNKYCEQCGYKFLDSAHQTEKISIHGRKFSFSPKVYLFGILIMLILISIWIFDIEDAKIVLKKLNLTFFSSKSEENYNNPNNLQSQYQDPLMTTITPTTPINLTKTAISLQSQEYKLGDSIYSQMDGMEMIYIPEGEFIMGADPNQGYQICLKDLENCALVNYYIEQPIHSVFLGSFWIDKSEITNEMFAEFLNTQGNQSEQGVSWYNTESNYAQIKYENGKWKPESNKGDFPVGDVTWYAAKAYCEWVGRRLPSEAEWEKAARGDDERIYPWGNLDPSLDLANYSHQSYGLTPVGSFSPQGDSPYGVQDMAGNSLEWVNDWFSYGYYEDSPKNNPQGPTFGSEKVLRGGMTGYEDVFIRTTARYWRDPNSSIIINGFRCAKSASD